MAKGDDALTRKKNKAHRKKVRNDSSTVSARVAAIIATKKRRQSGKRRLCQGMCFSLPSPDDPFNDRHGKMDVIVKKTKKNVSSLADRKVSMNGKSALVTKENVVQGTLNFEHEELKKEKDMVFECGKRNLVKSGKAKIQRTRENGVHEKKSDACKSFGSPSKFLIMCLNSIQNGLQQAGTYNIEEEEPLFARAWGLEFWKCYSAGKDILETSGASSTFEQIAWMVSTVADTIVRKEEEGFSSISPYLLFLVSSQEKASQVRSVCKPLKAHGIHSVSLHPGASLNHQIHGLKSCEPEFLVSTPERLWELVALKAIDISGVFTLVVDGLETFRKGGCLEAIKSIRQSISGNPYTVLFNDGLNYGSGTNVQSFLAGSICRLSLNESITSQSSCILQCIHVSSEEEEKLSKGIQFLDQTCNQLSPPSGKVLIITGRTSKFQKIVAALECNNIETENSKRSSAISVIDAEHIDTIELEEHEAVVILDFVTSINIYIQILTRMARHTVNGVLQSFLTREDASLAGPLIDILEQCGQTVPETLRNLCHSTSPMLEQ